MELGNTSDDDTADVWVGEDDEGAHDDGGILTTESSASIVEASTKHSKGRGSLKLFLPKRCDTISVFHWKSSSPRVLSSFWQQKPVVLSFLRRFG